MIPIAMSSSIPLLKPSADYLSEAERFLRHMADTIRRVPPARHLAFLCRPALDILRDLRAAHAAEAQAAEARRSEAYGQLMLAEAALEDAARALPAESEPAARALCALRHLGAAKGLLACCLLVLSLHLAVDYDDPEARRARQGAKLVRVARAKWDA